MIKGHELWEIKDNTIELGKIVKNAIIYVIRAIDINELKKIWKTQRENNSKNE